MLKVKLHITPKQIRTLKFSLHHLTYLALSINFFVNFYGIVKLSQPTTLKCFYKEAKCSGNSFCFSLLSTLGIRMTPVVRSCILLTITGIR